MKAKKMVAIVFACVLVLGMAACNTTNANSSGSLPGGTPGTAGAGTELNPDSSQPGDTTTDGDESQVEIDSLAGSCEFSDDNVTIDLSLDRESYTVNDVVGLKVTITNKADTPIVYQTGSGSNRVPDGLKVVLGGLTSMHTPTIATLDMRYDHIMPGESVTFEMPYAPYVANADNLLGPGFDQTLDWFVDNEDYTPAEVGTVDGTLTFSYQLMETESVEGPYDQLAEGGTPHVIEGTFSTDIVDAQ